MSVQSFRQAQVLISQFGSVHNERVRKYFRKRNVDQSEEAKKREFLGALLAINPARDNMLLCIFKFLFFYMLVGAAFDGLAQVYGTPVRMYQAATNFQPQILIRFREREINKADLPLRTYRLEKEISFHLAKEKTPKNKQELKALANKCKTLFFPAGKAYNYNSGLTTYRYKDDDNLYKLAIDVKSRQIALQIIEKCLDVQGLSFDADGLSNSDFTKGKPQKITVLGKRVDKPIRGRVGKVYAFQIEYHQKGLEPRVLVNPNGVIPF